MIKHFGPFTNAILKIMPYIEKYKDTKNLEVELRLGFIEDNDSFTTNIGKTFYEKILKVLEDSSGPDTGPVFKKSTNIIKDSFSLGRRRSVTDSSEQPLIIKKTKLCTLDFQFDDDDPGPFDIRVSFSTEEPMDSFDETYVTHTRIKTRTSFEYKDYVYDLTIVESVENSVTKKEYEIELEIRGLKRLLKDYSNYYLVHDALLKMRDLCSLCEKVGKECKLIFIQEK
jgi:hypothetical protein